MLLSGRHRSLGDLLIGTDSETMRANAALADLAALVREDPELRHIFTSLTARELVQAVATRPAAARLRDAMDLFLRRYGHRESSTVLLPRDPSWADAPEIVLGLVRALVGQAGGRRALGRRSPDRPVLRRLTASAVEGVAMREDTHVEISRQMPVLRHTVLELGRRLAAHGWLERPDDVWWLLRGEVADLPDPAAGHPARDALARLREDVDRRRSAYAALAGSPLIASSSLYPARADAPDALLTGVPGGGGRATGAVRVVPGPDAFGTLLPGEVLVCPATSPPWTPLFARAAAVVVDHGGPASHAAIVAREYGVPVVLATATGTTVLRTGQRVTVDGDHGRVVAADAPDGP